jgi:hypothetical protein
MPTLRVGDGLSRARPMTAAALETAPMVNPEPSLGVDVIAPSRAHMASLRDQSASTPVTPQGQ